MTRSRSKRRRGRAAPEPRDAWGWSVLNQLGYSLPRPVLGLMLAILLIGIGPVLLVNLFGITGVWHNLLVALGPTLVCLCFAGLTFVYGNRYAEDIPGGRRRVLWLSGMFVILAVLAAWGLFVSV